DEFRIEINAEATRTPLRRLDDDPTVTRTEVDDRVFGSDLSHPQHPLDDLHRRNHIRHRAVVPGPGLTLSVDRQEQRENGEKQPSRHDGGEGYQGLTHHS